MSATQSERPARDPWRDPFPISAIHEQARIVHEVGLKVRPQVEQVITPELAGRIRHVYITGCGDSYFVGLAARLAFEKYAGITTEPIEALEFSRYVADYVPADSLVISISNSGSVARTVETALYARAQGATSIGITGTAGSPLAAAVGHVLIQNIPELTEDWGPYGVGSLSLGNFHATLVTLLQIAFRLGALRQHISQDDVNDGLATVDSAAPMIAATCERNDKTAEELAAALWNLETFCIIGGGPSYAVALFGMAKLLEQPQLNGVAQGLEEWAHEQYFLVRPNATAVFVVCPPGRSRDRAIEQIHGIRDMGGIAIAICDSDDTEIQSLASHSLRVYGRLPEEFSSLTYVVPSELFAMHLHRIKGRPPMIPPYSVEQQRDINYRQIFHSDIQRP